MVRLVVNKSLYDRATGSDEPLEEIIKSWSGDLMQQYPTGRWITSNGSRIFIVPSKEGKKRVIAGLNNFNGIIDEFFNSDKVDTTKNKNLHGIKADIDNLYNKQKEFYIKNKVNATHSDMIEKFEKEYPNEYKKASKQFAESSENKDRQTIFDNYYSKIYPKEHKQIQELDKLRDKISSELEGYGIYKDSYDLSRIGAAYGLNETIDSYYYNNVISDVNDRIKSIEIVKNPKEAEKELSKHSMKTIQDSISSLDFLLESNFMKKKTSKYNKEYLDYIKLTRKVMSEYKNTHKKMFSDFKEGDTVFEEYTPEKREAGIAYSRKEDGAKKVTKITDKFIYIDGKRYPKDIHNFYKVVQK